MPDYCKQASFSGSMYYIRPPQPERVRNAPEKKTCETHHRSPLRNRSQTPLVGLCGLLFEIPRGEGIRGRVAGHEGSVRRPRQHHANGGGQVAEHLDRLLMPSHAKIHPTPKRASTQPDTISRPAETEKGPTKQESC